ncbi:hypothetical protein D3C80_1738310 [compost metagenome]
MLPTLTTTVYGGFDRHRQCAVSRRLKQSLHVTRAHDAGECLTRQRNTGRITQIDMFHNILRIDYSAGRSPIEEQSRSQ